MEHKYYFDLDGLTCGSCVQTVQNVLYSSEKLPIVPNGIYISLVDLKMVMVLEDKASNPANMLTAGDSVAIRREVTEELENIGYGCKPEYKLPFWRRCLYAISGIGCGFALMGLMLLPGLGPLIMLPSAAIAVLLTIVLGWELSKTALQKLYKTRTMTMDFLFFISTSIITIVSIAAIFVPWLPMMFDAALMIFGFRHMGKAIEETIREKVGNNTSYVRRLPRTIIRIHDDAEEVVDIASLVPGDIIRVVPGGQFPVDCELLDESASIIDTVITGAIRSRIVTRTANNQILLYSGTVVTPSTGMRPVTGRVLATVQDSWLATLDRQSIDAGLEKAPVESLAEKILHHYFIPSVLVLAGLSALATGIFLGVPFAIHAAVSVLVSACPCTLGFIIPLGVKIGMARARDEGIKFRNSKMLQEAAAVETVIFDLNGTLTEGVPKVAQHALMPDADLDVNEFMLLLHTLEYDTDHIIGHTIAQYAGRYTANRYARHNVVTHHAGVEALINNKHCVLGTEEMLGKFNIPLPTLPEGILHAGDSVIYCAYNGKVVGYLVIIDPLRHDAVAAIAELKSQGKKIKICTGASRATALRYAIDLAIDAEDVFAECGGALTGTTTKADCIRRIQGEKAFIGDGANDSVAVNLCFGVAIKSEQAQHDDPVTLGNAGAVVASPSKLPQLFSIATRTANIIRQNFIFSFSYNFVALSLMGGILLALGIMLNPAVGAALMVLQSAIILGNSLVYLRESPKSLPIVADNLLVTESWNTMSRVLSCSNTPGVSPEEASVREILPEIASEAPQPDPVNSTSCEDCIRPVF